MTQEDKNLLLKDLCGRIPYGVRMLELDPINNIELELYLNNVSLEGSCCVNTKDDGIICSSIDAFKPYLFPISSMTEEQKKEYCQLQQKIIYNNKGPVNTDIMNYINWCYRNHIDVNGLIPLDLAIDATNKNIY